MKMDSLLFLLIESKTSVRRLELSEKQKSMGTLIRLFSISLNSDFIGAISLIKYFRKVFGDTLQTSSVKTIDT